MKKANAIFWGIILIALGTVLVLVQLDFIENINIFKIRYMWPAFMILLGLMFHVQFFAGRGKAPGILVPGGILLVYGSLFLYMNIDGWGNMQVLWPMFLVGPGFGLLELKLFSRGREGSWIPVIILFGLACMFFFVYGGTTTFATAAAIALIVIGVAIIISSVVEGQKNKDKKIDIKVDVE